MQYPTVTEKPVARETIAHDTFIDGLETPPAAEPASPRPAHHHRRRRRRASRPGAARTRP